MGFRLPEAIEGVARFSDGGSGDERPSGKNEVEAHVVWETVGKLKGVLIAIKQESTHLSLCGGIQWYFLAEHSKQVRVVYFAI
jgi:hypothetical protein